MIEYATIFIIALLAAISPGPDFVVVAKNALSYNRQSAVMTSVGIGVGILFHTTYCVIGFAIIISQSLILFSIIKYLGASYLIYLGVKSLFSKSSNPSSAAYSNAKLSITAWQSFRVGLLTNVLNPKCTLFMLSVFTLVIRPTTPHLQQASYGVEIALVTSIWFVFLSYGFTHPIIKTKINKVQHHVNKAIGIVLITLGAAVFFEGK